MTYDDIVLWLESENNTRFIIKEVTEITALSLLIMPEEYLEMQFEIEVTGRVMDSVFGTYSANYFANLSLIHIMDSQPIVMGC